MASDEHELLDVFAAFYRTVCEERDPDAAIALWAPDDDIVLFGSEQRDTAFGRDAIHAHLRVIAASTAEIVFSWERHQVHVEGDAAWVNAIGSATVDGRASNYQTIAAFVRRDGRWLWHAHGGSEPHS